MRVQREVERMELLVRDLLLLAQVRETPYHPSSRGNLSELVERRASPSSRRSTRRTP